MGNKKALLHGPSWKDRRNTLRPIYGRPNIVAWHDDQDINVDAKAAKPNPSHEIQVMLYMTWPPMIDPGFQKTKLSGEVYYGEDATINIPAPAVDGRFKEITARLIRRVTSRTTHKKAPSDSECRFCPISSPYCPERIVR